MQSAVLSLLVVEDDPLYVQTLALTLTAKGSGQTAFALCFAADGTQALAALARDAAFDLILLDLQLGAKEHGLELLPKLRQAAPNVPVVVHSVVTHHATVVAAMRLGAFDYLAKAPTLQTLPEQLLLLLQRAREQARPAPRARPAGVPAPAPARAPAAVVAARTAAPKAPPSFGMVGSSEALRALQRQIQVALPSRGSVLIGGESGAGKELVARAFAQPGKPFVAVDAATLEGPLAPALLFGSVRGAYTGADGPRAGLFEQAHGGLLYLDEVANMSLEVQAKLLRVLEQREVTRLGCSKVRPLHFRLVTATHAHLPALCQAGRFRADLLARLQVFCLAVPPLRARRQDILPLFKHFLRRTLGHDVAVEPAAEAELVARPFWGNVRELAHAAEVAAAHLEAQGRAAAVAPEHLPAPLPELRAAARAQADGAPGPAPGEAAAPSHSFHAQVRAFERQTLIRSFGEHGGNISAMARTLGLDRSRLYAKLRLYAIHAPPPGP